MRTIAFVTYGAAPELAVDDRPVPAHLPPGVAVEAVPWDARGVAWEDYDAVVLRSCWDYHLRPGAFLEWLDGLARRGAAVWNPPAVVAWNADKAYLHDLAGRGVPIVPTVRLARRTAADLASVLEGQGWAEAVVKPSISGGAYRTWRTSRAAAGAHQRRLDDLLAGGDVLVQPFLAEVEAAGEWSVVFIDGAYSHAVRKRPRPGDFRVQEAFGGATVAAEPPPGLRAQAARALAAVPGLSAEPLLYARVDGIEVEGTFYLLELELIEPTLFFAYDAQAPRRFAGAVAARAVR